MAVQSLIRVEVTRRGNIGEGAARGAEMKVADALASTRGVLSAHVVLDWRSDPAVAEHALAEVTVDVGGTSVRAHAAGETMHEAVDAMVSRLVRRIGQLAERERDRHRWTSVDHAHEWRHGSRPRPALAYYPRPPEQREVVRRTSVSRTPLTLDEAAFDLDLLDYDFLLFTEEATGRPAVLRRVPEGGYALQRPEGVDGPVPRGAVRLDPPAPTLRDAQARVRLEASHEPSVFYLDLGTGLGHVLYLRYDGHYGVLTEGDHHRW